jgi:hypothetical protein
VRKYCLIHSTPSYFCSPSRLVPPLSDEPQAVFEPHPTPHLPEACRLLTPV